MKAGGIPENWCLRKLGQLIDFENGKAHEDCIIDEGQFVLVNSRFISTNGTVRKFSLENRSPLFCGDIVMVMSDVPNGKALAKCFLIDKNNKYTLNQRICVLRTNSHRSGFLYYVLDRNQYYLQFDNGVGQTNLRKNEVLDCPIFLPPPLEQTAIASILSTSDQAIEKTERLIAAKQKRFSWLGRTLISKQREKLGWYKVKIGDVCKPIITKNNIGETNILTSSAQHGLISQLDYYSKSVSGSDLSGYYLLKKGEFAYNRSSANGYPYGAIKRLDYCDQGVFSTLYLCFKISEREKIYSDFLCHYFESGCMNRSLREICQAGARSHGLLNVSKNEFFNLKLFLPPLDQQKQIASILNTATQEIDLLKKQADAYRKQKRGLMQKLLTGQWRINITKEE